MRRPLEWNVQRGREAKTGCTGVTKARLHRCDKSVTLATARQSPAASSQPWPPLYAHGYVLVTVRSHGYELVTVRSHGYCALVT
eukprot:4800709-Pyramimonas_sp.AAC.1